MSFAEECGALRSLLLEERKIHGEALLQAKARAAAAEARAQAAEDDLWRLHDALRELAGCA